MHIFRFTEPFLFSEDPACNLPVLPSFTDLNGYMAVFFMQILQPQDFPAKLM